MYEDRLNLVRGLATLFYRALRRTCRTVADVQKARQALQPGRGFADIEPWMLRLKKPAPRRAAPTVLWVFAVHVASASPRIMIVRPPDRGPSAKGKPPAILQTVTVMCAGRNATSSAYLHNPPDERLRREALNRAATMGALTKRPDRWHVAGEADVEVDLLDAALVRVVYTPKMGPAWAAAEFCSRIFGRKAKVCRTSSAYDFEADPVWQTLMKVCEDTN